MRCVQFGRWTNTRVASDFSPTMPTTRQLHTRFSHFNMFDFELWPALSAIPHNSISIALCEAHFIETKVDDVDQTRALVEHCLSLI